MPLFWALSLEGVAGAGCMGSWFSYVNIDLNGRRSYVGSSLFSRSIILFVDFVTGRSAGRSGVPFTSFGVASCCGLSGAIFTGDISGTDLADAATDAANGNSGDAVLAACAGRIGVVCSDVGARFDLDFLTAGWGTDAISSADASACNPVASSFAITFGLTSSIRSTSSVASISFSTLNRANEYSRSGPRKTVKGAFFSVSSLDSSSSASRNRSRTSFLSLRECASAQSLSVSMKALLLESCSVSSGPVNRQGYLRPCSGATSPYWVWRSVGRTREP